jgi:hypothetical protein
MIENRAGIGNESLWNSFGANLVCLERMAPGI